MANDGYRIYTETVGGVKYGVDVQADVYKVLGLARQSGGYDLAYACGNEHGKIAPFAKYKPVRTDELDTSDSTWKGGITGQCGFEIPEYSNPGNLSLGLIEGLASGAARWTYLAPRPGTDWCRLSDFDGYNHRAASPFPVVTAGPINKQSNGRVVISLSYGLMQANGNLTLADLKFRATSLTDYYLGVAIWNDSKSYYAISENAGLSESSFEFPSGITNGDYYAAVFLSSVPMQNGYPQVGFYIAAGAAAPSEIAIADYVPDQEAAIRGDMVYGGSTVSYRITFYNNAASPFTFSNITIIVTYKDDLGAAVSVGRENYLTEITVESGGSATITGSVSLLPELGAETHTYYIEVRWTGGSAGPETVMTTIPTT